jgi:hypothetical protein
VARAPRMRSLGSGEGGEARAGPGSGADIVRLIGAALRERLGASEPVLVVRSSRDAALPRRSVPEFIETAPELALSRLYERDREPAFVLVDGVAAIAAVGEASLLGAPRHLWGRGLVVVETDSFTPDARLERLRSGPVDWRLSYRDAIEKGLLSRLRFVELVSSSRGERGLEQLLGRPELQSGPCRVHVSNANEQAQVSGQLDKAGKSGVLTRPRAEIDVVPRRAPASASSRGLRHLVLLSEESPRTLVAQVEDALVSADPGEQLQVWELSGVNAPKRRETLQRALGFELHPHHKGPRWSFEADRATALATAGGRLQSPSSRGTELFEERCRVDGVELSVRGALFDLNSIAERVSGLSSKKKVAVSAGLYAGDLDRLLGRARLIRRNQQDDLSQLEVEVGEVLLLEKRGGPADRLPRVDAVFLLPPRPKSVWSRAGVRRSPRRRPLQPHVAAFLAAAKGGELEFIDCYEGPEDARYREHLWADQLAIWADPRPPGGERRWEFEVARSSSDDPLWEVRRLLERFSDRRVVISAGDWAKDLSEGLSDSLLVLGKTLPQKWDEPVAVLQTRSPAGPIPPVDVLLILPPKRKHAWSSPRRSTRKLEPLVETFLADSGGDNALTVIDLCDESDDLEQRRRLWEQRQLRSVGAQEPVSPSE